MLMIQDRTQAAGTRGRILTDPHQHREFERVYKLQHACKAKGSPLMHMNGTCKQEKDEAILLDLEADKTSSNVGTTSVRWPQPSKCFLG
jgi:hypothetical protein